MTGSRQITTLYARLASSSLVLILALAATLVAGVAGAQAAPPPIKEILSSHIANGFEFPNGVAVNDDLASPEHGYIYVTDTGHNRVQILTATGAFVAMFGLEVDQTKTEAVRTLRVKGETPTQKELEEENLCTAASGDTCQAGEGGEGAGALRGLGGVAVDPSTGDVYVQEESNWRVDEYTAEGRFVLMMGRGVNETKDDMTGASEAEKNVCTEASKDVCKEGVPGAPEGKEHDAFNFVLNGDVLAVGGPEDLLYVGEEGRVQELEPDGEWAGEFPVSGTVTSLAIDNDSGTFYVASTNESGSRAGESVIHEFDAATGEELSSSITVTNAVFLDAIAVDPSGHLAVAGIEERLSSSGGRETRQFGRLYEAGDGHPISDIAAPPSENQSLEGLTFSEDGDLYAAEPYEVLLYSPKAIGEVTVSPTTCGLGTASGSSLTFACALSGEVDPEGVAETEASFESGKTSALGRVSARQQVSAPEAVHTVVGLRPSETLYYQLAGYDRNVHPPESFTSEQLSVSTPSVAPRILSTLSASFTTSSSSDLFGELNPENTSTTYAFQYAPACPASGGSCPPISQAPGMVETQPQESAEYGALGTVAEVTGLQPSTTYRYTLIAKNATGEAAVNEAGAGTLPEGTFTTGPAAIVQAATGPPNAITPTSAVLSGTVNPDGQPAAYSFELGVYAGASTSYGIVLSGSVPAESSPVVETAQLTGLQPGTTYAYRIVIHGGYGEMTGAPVMFTTEGLPAVLSSPTSLPVLAVPGIAFPAAAKPPVVKKAVRCPKARRRVGGKCVEARPRRKRGGGRKLSARRHG